jgi:hypothetical protein
MLSCRVLLEAHGTGATIYVAGHLSSSAAERTEAIVAELPSETRVIRLDLRAVDLTEPTAFVRVAGALNRWRARVRGRRITIEFPQRSRRRTPASGTLNVSAT